MNRIRQRVRYRMFSFGITCVLLLVGCHLAAADAHAKSAAQAPRLGREFQLKAGQQVTLQREGLRIKFDAVTQDSRCPADVTCVWAGNAAVRLEVGIRGRGKKSLTLNTSSGLASKEDNQYRGYELKLVGLRPYPRSNQKIAPRDYVATLLVRRD